MIDLFPEIEKIISLKGIKPGNLNENTIIEDKSFREFIIKINLSQQYLKSFSKAVIDIKNKRKNLILSTSQKEINTIKEEITDKIDSCKEIQKSIKELIVGNESFLKQCKSEDRHYSRLVANMYSAALKRFEKVTDFFTLEQTNVSDFLKQSIIREAEIASKRKLTPDEMQKVIENPELIQEMIKSKLEGEAHIDLINKVNDLQSRHNDIKNLEKSIEGIYQLFVDLQELVRNQGQIIENIEDNIATAKESTMNAELDVSQSYEYLKAARKKKCIILIISVVVIIIILSIVLPTSLLKK